MADDAVSNNAVSNNAGPNTESEHPHWSLAPPPTSPPVGMPMGSLIESAPPGLPVPPDQSAHQVFGPSPASMHSSIEPESLPSQPSKHHPFDWSESRWGMGDILLGLVVIAIVTIGAGILATIVLGIVSSEAGFGLGALGSPDDAWMDETGLAIVGVVTMIGLQASTFSWPVIVARWKGRGLVSDFGFRFKWVDFLIGPAMAIPMMMAAGVVGYGVSTLVGLEDQSEAGNTEFLTDSTPGLVRYALIFFVVVGAPFSEELFFRGLSMRAIQKRFGKPIALLGSTALFTLPHFQGGSWQAVVVMLATIGTIGLLLGGLAIGMNRLGPGIVAHATFNSIAAVVALNPDYFEELEGAMSAIWVW